MDEKNSKAEMEHLVQRFRVCWEVNREQAVVDGNLRDIGFDLDLYGTHEPGTDHVTPGCEHCHRVQSALRQIAEWILPREERPSTYEISVENQSLIYSPRRRNRPEVRVTIRILHRSGFEQPIDDCELRCLADMKQALIDIGACKSAWAAAAKPYVSGRAAKGSVS